MNTSILLTRSDSQAPKVRWRPQKDDPTYQETQQVYRPGSSSPSSHRGSTTCEAADHNIPSISSFKPFGVYYYIEKYPECDHKCGYGVKSQRSHRNRNYTKGSTVS